MLAIAYISPFLITFPDLYLYDLHLCGIFSAHQPNLFIFPSLPPPPIFQVAGAYSKSWSYREHAILDVCRKLSELPPTTPREEQRNMIRAAVSLLKKALLDKVASVSLVAASGGETLQPVLSGFLGASTMQSRTSISPASIRMHFHVVLNCNWSL